MAGWPPMSSSQRHAVAYIMMNVDLGREDEAIKELRKMKIVTDVYKVRGVYDLVARLQADSVSRIKETVSAKIEGISSVRSALTMLASERTP